MLADRDGHAILIILAMAYQAQIGVLDPQTFRSATLLHSARLYSIKSI